MGPCAPNASPASSSQHAVGESTDHKGIDAPDFILILIRRDESEVRKPRSQIRMKRSPSECRPLPANQARWDARAFEYCPARRCASAPMEMFQSKAPSSIPPPHGE